MADGEAEQPQDHDGGDGGGAADQSPDGEADGAEAGDEDVGAGAGVVPGGLVEVGGQEGEEQGEDEEFDDGAEGVEVVGLDGGGERKSVLVNWTVWGDWGVMGAEVKRGPASKEVGGLPGRYSSRIVLRRIEA